MSGTLTTNDRPLYSKLPGESAKAYRAFEIFRSLPLPRTSERAWEEYKAEGKMKAARPSSAWRGWKKDHRWVERAEAYDAHQLAINDPEEYDAILEARNKIIARLPELVDHAIELALATDDPNNSTMLRDLLDRVGLTKPSPKSGGNLTVTAEAAQFNFDFGQMETADIQNMIASLKE